jgi:hypothetical protein
LLVAAPNLAPIPENGIPGNLQPPATPTGEFTENQTFQALQRISSACP